MNPVTVIIPSWNRAHTLGAAVNSVLAQTYPVLEILVCDDGSTDNSRDVINSFQNPKVRFIEGPRAGRPAVPRNRGIKIAKGTWVAFLDSDDAWTQDKLEKQFQRMSKDGTSACSTNAWRVLPGKGRTNAYLSIPHQQLRLRDLLESNYVICSSVVVQKNLLDEVGGFPEAENLKAIEDYALWLRIASKTSFSYCAEPLVEYLDDAVNSVRSEAKENVQRENVMNDFYGWYVQQELQDDRSRVRNALRKAMKNNGRSFFERWRIK